MTRRNRFYAAQTAHTPSSQRDKLAQVRVTKERWITYRDVCLRGASDAGRQIDQLTTEELEIMTALGEAPGEVTE